MMPLVGNDGLWRSGLAGGIPAAAANAIAALLLFLVARDWLGRLGGWLAMALFLANPNVLYLGSIPMTEPFFFAAFFGLLWASSRAAGSGSLGWAAAAGGFALAGTMIRYEGWFLLPFAALYIARTRLPAAILFGAIAGLGPAYWLLHNLWLDGDPFSFYHGPYSHKAIYQRALDAKTGRHPGDHEFFNAIRYVAASARLAAGWPLAVLGLVGAAAMIRRKLYAPSGLLCLPPLFYMWSMYGGGSPIFVPHLWPHTWYNTRYGLAAIPLFAVGAAAFLCAIPGGARRFTAPAILAVASIPWLIAPAPEGWICWKESQVNSDARRAWTAQAAAYLREHYRGGGIVSTFGDAAGVYQEAGIPLRETVNECNQPHFMALLARPDLFLREEWAVAMEGDAVDRALHRAIRTGPRYQCVRTIRVPGAPAVRIWRFRSRAGLKSPGDAEIEEARKAWEEAEER